MRHCLYGSSKPGNRSFGRFSRPLLEDYFSNRILACSKGKSLAVAEIFRYCKGFCRSYRAPFCLLDQKYKRGLSNSLFDRLSAGSESRLCIFGDMMTILQNNTFSRDNLSVGGNGVRNIHYGDVLIKYGAVLDLHSENVPVINAEQDISKFSALSYLRNGDVVFADTAEDYTVGKSTEIIGAENIAALSGLHTIPCRPQDSFAPMYLGYYFNSDYFKKQLYPMIQGTKVSSISKSEIIKTKIIVPCLQEQTRIASIMSALDDRIDAAKHTTKDLIDLRSGLLQQLFI